MEILMLKILYPMLLFSPVVFAMSIQECVNKALDNNPDIKKQELNYKLNRLNYEESSSKDYGKFNAVGSYTHYNLPRTLVPLTPASIFSDPTAVATTKDLMSLGVTYDVVLFTGFAQKRSLEISSLQKEMAQAKIKLGREQLIYNVKSLYINILALKSQEEAQEKYIQALHSLHKNIQDEVKLGKKSKLEELKSAAFLEDAKNIKSKLHSNITILKASLTSLMNVENIGTLKSMDITLDKRDIQEPSLDELERFKISSIEIQKSNKTVQKSESAYYPQVGLSGYYGQNFGPNDDTNKNTGDWHNEELWQAGVNLKWNIYDFGGRDAASQKAKIQALNAKLEDSKTRLEFTKLLTQAQSKIDSALQSYKSAKAQLALVSQTEKIEQIRFDNGASDINDLLIAKSKTQLLKSQLISTKYQYQIENFYLQYLLEQGDKR
jgi:outer membrane protein TolC